MRRRRASTPVDLVLGDATAAATDPRLKSRFGHIALNLACFAVGCAVAALTFTTFGFWCAALTLPAAIVAVALTPSGLSARI